jgi:hypothetical protein
MQNNDVLLQLAVQSKIHKLQCKVQIMRGNADREGYG